jgi:iron-regulated transporter 1
VLATLVFPLAQRTLGLVRAGAGAIAAQLACLLLAAAPAVAAAAGAPLGAGLVTHALVGGLVLSRFGLWSFDLAVNQLIQEVTPSPMLGELAAHACSPPAPLAGA